MSDIVDRAAEAEETFRQAALAARERQIPRGAAAGTCADCGEPIPAARRRAAPGATRCLDCQQWAERYQQQERPRR